MDLLHLCCTGHSYIDPATHILFMEQSSTVSSLINSRPFLLVYFIEQVGKAADKVADIV